MDDISAATMLGIASIIAFSVAVFFMIMLAVAHADSAIGKFFPDWETQYWEDLQRWLNSHNALGDDTEDYFSMCWHNYLDGCRKQDQQDIIQFLNNNTELWK